jgi:pimeloyl-[acyl-carrier protein] methyl ester esterase
LSDKTRQAKDKTRVDARMGHEFPGVEHGIAVVAVRLRSADAGSAGARPQGSSGFRPGTGELGGCAAGAVWAGWSLGGLAALAAALKAPQQVSALVLVASSPRFAQAPDWPHAIEPDLLYKFEAGLRGDYRKLLEDFIVLQTMGASRPRDEIRRLRACLHEGGEPAPEALGLGLKFLLQVDMRDALRELSCPCLLVLGERDKLVPSQLAEVFRREYPQVEVRIIEGSGHAPFLSHATEFADTVSRWIKSSVPEPQLP